MSGQPEALPARLVALGWRRGQWRDYHPDDLRVMSFEDWEQACANAHAKRTANASCLACTGQGHFWRDCTACNGEWCPHCDGAGFIHLGACLECRGVGALHFTYPEEERVPVPTQARPAPLAIPLSTIGGVTLEEARTIVATWRILASRGRGRDPITPPWEPPPPATAFRAIALGEVIGTFDSPVKALRALGKTGGRVEEVPAPTAEVLAFKAKERPFSLDFVDEDGERYAAPPKAKVLPSAEARARTPATDSHMGAS